MPCLDANGLLPGRGWPGRTFGRGIMDGFGASLAGFAAGFASSA